ncbi:MAG: endonuclease/exonuclease/phosphatase family protein, partial [Acidimicrobiales bacterium]
VLAGAALALVVWHVVTVAPSLRPAAVPERARDAPVVRVFTANLAYGNPSAGRTAIEAADAGADVVAFQEVTAEHIESLEQAGIARSFPYRFLDPRRGAFGSAIYSRLALSATSSLNLAGLPITVATVSVGAAQVRLYNVHTMAPSTSSDLQRRNRQLAALAFRMEAEPGPVMAVGDFNATPWDPAFRRLLDRGFVDAHERTGRGLARTFPSGRRYPPVVLIDHVVVSPGVVPLRVWEGSGSGSDHRPVLADLAVTGEGRD